MTSGRHPKSAAEKSSACRLRSFSIKLAPDGKFLSGQIHGAHQDGRGGPILDNTGDSIRTVRSLSLADFGTNAPKIADDGTITR